MSTNSSIERPDPRRVTSWCHEGVAHDHQACGVLWNNHDPRDIEAAAAYADDLGSRERASAPATMADLAAGITKIELDASRPESCLVVTGDDDTLRELARLLGTA